MTEGIFTPVPSGRPMDWPAVGDEGDLTTTRPGPFASARHNEAQPIPEWNDDAVQRLANAFWRHRSGSADASGQVKPSDGPDGERGGTEADAFTSSPGGFAFDETPSAPGSLWGGIKDMLLGRLSGPSTGTSDSLNDEMAPPRPKRARTSTLPLSTSSPSTNTADRTLGAKIILASDDFFSPAMNLLMPGEAEFDPDLYGAYGKVMDGWETRRRRVPGHNWCILRLAAPTHISRVEISTRHFTGNYAPNISLEGARGVAPGELETWLGDAYPGDLIDLNNASDRTGRGHYVDEGQDFLDRLESLMRCDDEDGVWYDIVPTSALRPGTPEEHLHVFHPLRDQLGPVTYLRLNQFPDGGIARLRVFGEVARPLRALANGENFASIVLGGSIVSFSSAHFGHPQNLLLNYPPPTMQSGWETARQIDRPWVLRSTSECAVEWRSHHKEWVIIRLAQRVNVHMISVSTEKFIGNAPQNISIELFDGAKHGMPLGCSLKKQMAFFETPNATGLWSEVVTQAPMEPDALLSFDRRDMILASQREASAIRSYGNSGEKKQGQGANEAAFKKGTRNTNDKHFKGALVEGLDEAMTATHIRVTMVPDGGIARIGVYGDAELLDALQNGSKDALSKKSNGKHIVRSKRSS